MTRELTVYVHEAGSAKRLQENYHKLMGSSPQAGSESFVDEAMVSADLSNLIEEAMVPTTIIVESVGSAVIDNIGRLIYLLTDKMNHLVTVQFLEPPALLDISDEKSLGFFEIIALVQRQRMGRINYPHKKFKVSPSALHRMRCKRRMGANVKSLAEEFGVDIYSVYKYTSKAKPPEGWNKRRMIDPNEVARRMLDEEANTFDPSSRGFELYLENEPMELVFSYLKALQRTQTASEYARDLHRVFKLICGYRDKAKIADLKSIEKGELRRCYIDMIPGIRLETLARRVNVIKAFFGYLRKNELIENNPSLMLKAPKFDDSMVKNKPWAPSEVRALLEKALEIRDNKKKDKAHVQKWDRIHLALYLMSSCGLRIGGLLGIRLCNISPPGGAQRTLVVKRKSADEYIISLSRESSGVIDKYVDTYLCEQSDKRAYLIHFHDPFQKAYRRYFSDVIALLCRRCAIERDGRSCHSFRVFNASVAAQNRQDITKIKEVLGHKSINTTARYIKYAIDPEEMDVMKNVFPEKYQD